MNKKIPLVSLFSGAGGLDMGFENQGFQTIWANDFDKDACETHRAWSDAEVIQGDIGQVDFNSIPKTPFIIGGFPCQDYSVARTGAAGIDGKKGVLWWDIRDILETKSPSFVILENVDRLLKSPANQRGRDFGIILTCFNELGYNVEWRVINAAEYGYQQRRRRTFIFAYKEDTKYAVNVDSQIKYISQHGDEMHRHSMAKQILEEGFFAGHGESRPAKRIETASILGCISMETVQNEMHGGQAIPAFDFYMAPFVRRSFQEELDKIGEINGEDYSRLYNVRIDDYIRRDLVGIQGDDRVIQHAINMTVSRVHQAMEAFVHNMNSIHSRGGNQVVFSSINYGTDTSAEGRCVIREILNTTYEGVGNGSTAIFPIQIWKKKRGVSYLPEDRNYDLYKFACKVSARRFFPNFVNLDAPFNQHELWKAEDPKRYQYEVATMGCRTRVFENRFGPKTSIGRGNLSFTTINIVKLAIECMNIPDQEDRIHEFFHKLDWALDIAAKQLNERFNFQKTALKKQFPLLMGALWLDSEKLGENDTIEAVINHGTLGIGFIGLAEALIALCGKHHGESTEAQQLGLRIVTFMKDKVGEYCEKYRHNFSVLATPAEGLSGTFVRKDKKKYAEYETENGSLLRELEELRLKAEELIEKDAAARRHVFGKIG